MALSVGAKFGPYEIIAPLGTGGMGEVYRAKDTRLGRDVAIKILPKELSADPARKLRFEREAKTISGLNHPNICTLHDVGSQDGVDYLVMECVEGETLAARLQKVPMPLEQVMRYGAQIADALDKAHRAGIVHRDLKPGNVMLTASGAKLLDFGLAKAAATQISSLTLTSAVPTNPVTQEGTIVGTFQYMSPEQVEGKELDGRSDIFSLGAVLYEMVTGQHAFEGKSQLSVASAILEKEPATISSLKPLTPSTLERTIKKCLEKLPDDRWQSASDLASQLKWNAEAGLPSSSTAGATGRGPKAGTIYAGLVLVAAIAIALAGLAWWRSSVPREKSVVRFSMMRPASEAILTNTGPALALSSDGSRIVFVVAHGKSSQLAVRDLSSFDAKLIPGTEGAQTPFFSPDGEWLGFMAAGKLRKISVSGGPAIDLADLQNPIGGTWLVDGTIVFNPEFSGRLQRVPASGGKMEVLIPPDPTKGDAWQWRPESLPGGDILFTLKRGEGAEEGSIAVLSMKTGKWKTVIDKAEYAHYSPSGHLVYLQNGAILAVPFDLKRAEVTGTPVPVLQGVQYAFADFAQFSIARNGTLAYISGPPLGLQNTLVSVDRTGRETPLRAPPRGYEDLALSPNGKLLALTVIGEQQWNIWIFDIQQGTMSRLTFEGDNRDPIWSADGRRVIYSSSRNGRKGIFWKPVGGPGGEEELLDSSLQLFPSSVSMDGRFVMYDVAGWVESAGIYILPLQGERKAKLLFKERSAGNEAISPDGKWLAYESTESGRNEVYVRSFDSGAGKWQVSTDGGTHAWWSANGRELFFRSVNGRTETGGSLMSVTVSPSGEFTASPPRPLFPFSCVQSGHDYGVMPDGQHFICIKEPESETKAMQANVVLNWASELEKK
jgi:eukaryotic-like serine/threonine-protein kinase